MLSSPSLQRVRVLVHLDCLFEMKRKEASVWEPDAMLGMIKFDPLSNFVREVVGSHFYTQENLNWLR